MNEEEIKAPQCIDGGKHKMIDIEEEDSVFWCQCEKCFERFILMSETVASQLNVLAVPREINKEI